MSEALASADRRADGSSSRPSQNNRHGIAEAPEPGDFDLPRSEFPDSAPATTDLAARAADLRREAAAMREPDGRRYPLPEQVPGDVPDENEVVAKQTYAVVNEWRDWYKGYESAHLTFENQEGETVRAPLTNSHQPRYENQYYAKLKDLERGINRQYESLTTVMLTFTNSHENANGFPRAPADHMREIAEGWGTARKMVHKALSGRNWEYARIWEPHEDGYGHLHIALFVEGDATAAEFQPVMESYISNVSGAGSEAHSLENAVSVNDDVENIGSYVSEYLGAFQGDDGPLDRPITEQIFRATLWATNTRRLDFSNGAHDIIAGEEFRRETGLRPEDRGAAEAADEDAESGAEGAEPPPEEPEWQPRHIEYVHSSLHRERADPTSGGVRTVLSALQLNFPNVTFQGSFRLDADLLQASTTIAYNNSPEAMKMRLPVPLTVGEIVRITSFKYHVESHYRIAGLDLFEPRAVRYLTGL